MICRTCDGDRRLFWAVGFDDRNGAILYDSTPCTDCHGSGIVEFRSELPSVYVVLAIAFVVVLVIVVWVVAARHHG